MSRLEYVYLDSDLEPAAVAVLVAQKMGLQYLPPDDPRGWAVLRAFDLAGVPGFVGGPIQAHRVWLEDPDKGDEVGVDEGYRLRWTVWSEQRGDDYEDQERAAEALFLRFVDEVGWPSAFVTHDGHFLRATYDPDRGLRRFPERTAADSTGTPVWA